MKQFFQKVLRPRRAGRDEIISEVLAGRLTYLETPALENLYESVREVEERNVCGVMIETGCALGGSSIVICKAKKRERAFFVYDVFGLIPSPSDKDAPEVHKRYEEIKAGKSVGIGGDLYYGYQENLLQEVKSNFRKFGVPPEENNVQFVQGLYQDTLNVTAPVAFAHIDCDWYESVMVCLNQIVPRVPPGGVLVIDDYHYWPGCKKAVDEYFSDKRDIFEFTMKARLQIRRKQ